MPIGTETRCDPAGKEVLLNNMAPHRAQVLALVPLCVLIRFMVLHREQVAAWDTEVD